MLPITPISGGKAVPSNHLHWALAFLERSLAVEESPEKEPLTGSSSGDTRLVPSGAVQANAETAIAASARVIHQQLKRDLIDRIHAECPEFFERLVIELLLAMGYGCRYDLARHLGRRGDGGIDGAVPQDVLGLDVIYIQAKRYRPNSSVPTSAVREFAGSLDGRKARKGVFVTTATFAISAVNFVRAVPSQIALIDGHALADLLIGYNIGVKVRETYEVKQIDEAYLAAAQRRTG